MQRVKFSRQAITPIHKSTCSISLILYNFVPFSVTISETIYHTWVHLKYVSYSNRMRIKLLKFFIHKYVAFQRIKSYSDLYNLCVEVFLYRGFVSNFQEKKRNSVEHFQPIIYILKPIVKSKIHLYFFISSYFKSSSNLSITIFLKRIIFVGSRHRNTMSHYKK